MPNFEYEDKYSGCVAGVDEAGRGPLAGPVVAAAVILPRDVTIEGLDDSKKLTDKKRRTIYEEIKLKAKYAIALATPAEIDEINIRNAAFLAMKRAVDGLAACPDFVLVDGNAIDLIEQPCECVVKGDSKSLSIAAASILAKVYRDDIMLEYDREYPGYGFGGHKGYPTKAHYEAITEHGVLPIHRKSFRLG